MTKWKGKVVSCAPHLATLVPGAALSLGLLASPAMAADVYWDVNGGNPGQGGSGTWDLGTANWNQSADGVAGPFRAWDNVALDTAVFGGTGGTVAIADVVTAGGLSFASPNYTLQGGTVTLGGASTIDNSGVTTINSIVAGASGVTKSGVGNLLLNGLNTFSGNLQITQGGLTVNADTALGAAGNRVIMSGGTTLVSTGALNASREVELAGGVVAVGGGAGSARFTGAGALRAGNGVTLNNDASDFTGGVQFNVNGDAYFTSVGNIGEASSLGSDGTITFTAVNQYMDRLQYIGDGDTSNRNWATSYSGATSGALFLNNGSGTLTLTGNFNNGVGGGRNMSFSAQKGDFEFLGTVTSSNDTTLWFSGGGAERSITLAGANTYDGATVIGASNAGVGNPIGTVTLIAQGLADTGAASSFGTGIAGGIKILNNSVLRYTGGAASSNREWTIGEAGTNGGGAILNDGTGALALSGNVILGESNNNALTLGGLHAGTSTLSGTVSGSGDLVMDGAASNAWEITGANTRTGRIRVQGGTLVAGGASAFGTTTDLTVNGGTLDLNGFDLAAQSLAGTGGTVALGSADLSINQASGVNTTFAGTITGAGGLTKLGAGSLTLTSGHTYTGATTVGGGTLSLDFSAAGAPASNMIASVSTLNMAGGTLLVNGAAGTTNSQTFNGLNVTAGNNKVGTTAGSGGALDLHLGAISQSGGLVDFVKAGGGNITTTNTALGGWATVNGTDYAKVEAGNIVAFTEDDYTDQDNAATWQNGQYITDLDGFYGTVGANVQIAGLRYTEATPTTVTVGAAQTLGVDGTIIVAPSVDANDQVITGGSLTGTAGGGTLGIQQNSTSNFTIESQVVDNGGSVGFTKAGTGLVTLTNAGNSYTGATTVGQGTLSVASIGNGGVASGIGASTADASNLVIQGATLQYTGASATSDRGFTLGRSGAMQQGTIDVAQSGTTLTFDGVAVSGDGAGLTKTGAGTLALTNGNNSYTGVTTVNGGTLAAAVLTDGGVNSSIGAAGSDSANLVLSNGGTLDYTGATAASDRGFTLGTGDGGMGVSQAASTLTVSGTVVGDAGLRKKGDGTLVLSGANTYLGGTVVEAGTLRAGSQTAFGSPTAIMTVESGANLDLDGFNNTVGALNGAGNVDLGSATLTLNGRSGYFTGAITGSGGVTRTGAWTQTTLGANNTYTGVTTVNSGTLSIDSLANGGQASGIGAATADAANLVLNSATLIYTGGTVAIDRGLTLQGNGRVTVFDAATTLATSGTIVGGGTLIKAGAGTLVLSGANTSTGGHTLEQGVLRAGADNVFGTAAAAGGLTLANTAGTVADLAGFDNTVAYLNGGGANGGNISLGDGTLTIRTGSNNAGVIYSGAITGTGGLVKNGVATQRLHGCSSSYSGGTAINGGSIETNCLDDGGEVSSIGASTAAASNLVLNGGALRYIGAGDSTNREFTLGTAGGQLDASGTGALQFTSTAAITLAGTDTARTLTLAGTNVQDNILAALITDNGTGQTALTKTDVGTWRLTNPASTYSGITTINGGVLAVDKLADGGLDSSIGTSTGDAGNLVIGNNGTLRYTGSGDTTDRQFTLQPGVTFIESSGTGAVVFGNTAAATLAGSGARTVGLGGTNTDLNTLGGTIGDGAGGVTTFAKNGPGTWMLTGANTYSGNTVINDGNLIVGNGGTTGNVGTGNVIVDATSSTLSLNRSDTLTFAGTLSGPGTLAQIGTGTSILSSIGNTIGATRISAGALQVDGDLTTQTIAMTGTSALDVNGAVQAAGGLPSAITGDGGANALNVATGATLRANGDLGGGADALALSGTLDTGSGALSLGAGDDTFILRDGASITGAVLAGAGTDLLQADIAGMLVVDGASVGGFENLEKLNGGTLTLTGNHAYTAGTTISGGTLQVGNGGASGALASNVLNNGTLAFNRSDSYAFGGTITGSGAVNQIGAGTTILSGTNSYSGATNVQSGTLLVNGDQTAATAITTVASGATLGGAGIIGGTVDVLSGGAINPGAGAGLAGTLSIRGNLELANTSILNFDFGQANVVGGPLNDLITVAGDLTLDGVLNVSATSGGTFGPGIYRVIGYTGDFYNNGVSLSSPDYFLQTSVLNQVNLVNTDGVALNFWDGGGAEGDSVVSGGNGTWSQASAALWTTDTGSMNAPYANGSFAIFTGSPGTVNIDNTDGAIEASGMQFAVGGYSLSGDDLTLVGSATTPTSSIIRVGDGTTDGAGMVATINATVGGVTRLVKTDLGTLVLAGANSYTGGTRIEGGAISVAADANLGSASGNVELDGGTLRNTAAFVSARGVSLEDNGGTFQTDANLVLSGTVAGTGVLTKSGTATLTLNGVNTYAGGTVINRGTVAVSSDANLGAASGTLTVNGGTLQNTATFTSARAVTLGAAGGTFQTDADLTLAGVVAGAGALDKTGAATLVLTGENTYAGETTISGGTLQLGNGGASGTIAGNVVNQGALAFNRSDTYTFAGLISGGGVVNQVGSGTTILTANNTYADATTVQAGTLLVNGDQSGATGLTSVQAGATLGGNGTIGGDVDVAATGAMAPGGPTVTPGTLTINGSLLLADTSELNYNFGQAGVVGGAFNDLVEVGGDLTLDGVLNVQQSAGGDFGPGLYRIISYTGTLADNELTLGTLPAGSYAVQTSVDKQVNLVNATGLTLNFWDGPVAAGRNDEKIRGGSGLWRLAASDDWTSDTGAVNAPYANGAYAVFAGQAGTVTVDNTDGDVQAQGMQFATDGYVVTGDLLTLVGDATGASLVRVGDGTTAGTAMTATVEAVLSGNATLTKTDLGTLVLDGANTYTGGTAIKGGTLQVSGDANLGDNAGALALDGGTLHTTASFDSGRDVLLASTGTFLTDADTTLSLQGGLSGAGGFTKAGTGSLVLNGSSTYAGPTNVAQGALRAGAAGVFSASSAVSVLADAELDLAGFNQTVASLSNAGTMRMSGATAGAQLTVSGDYAANSGTLLLNTVLAGDNAATDRLIVNGATSGDTNVKVVNVGGAGAQTVEGIKIVDVSGASNGNFSLQGDYVFNGAPAVVGGAYAYRLYKGGVSTPADGDWYLRSTLSDPGTPPAPGGDDGTGGGDQPLYQPGVPVYEAYAGAMQTFNQLGTLQQRVGNRSWEGNYGGTALPQGSVDGNGVWTRVQGSYAEFDPKNSTSGSKYDASTWKFQAGMDANVHENTAGRFVAGAYVQYGTVSSDVRSVHGKGGIDTTGYGLGGTLTWYGNSGLYVDGQLQAIRYDSDLRSSTAGRSLVNGNDGTGYSASVEVGKRVPLSSTWSLTPQAQLSYSSVKFDDFTDPFGARVSLDKSDSTVGRLGLAIDRQTESSSLNGKATRSHVYGLLNLYYDFANGSRVNVGGTPFKSQNDPLRGGIGFGWSLNSADEKYSIYGETLADTSLENFGDSTELRGTVGVRVRW